MSTQAALEGWYREEAGETYLIGKRCTSCGSYYFPPAVSYCRNPDCDSSDFEEVSLSRQGVLWSFSKQYYQPPKPYVVREDEEFQPYVIAAAQLEKEKIIILGQMSAATDVDSLSVGDAVEVVLEPLFQDEQGVTHTVWKWQACK